MANREQIRKLKKGVAAWNKWREQNPQLIPDFSDADLAGIQLKPLDDFEGTGLLEQIADCFPSGGANLRKANLRNSKLRGAYLRAADFTGAELSGANLSESDSSGAFFNSASALSAVFDKARLLRAEFNKARLEKALLYGAEFKEAEAHSANFCGSLLSVAKFDRADVTAACFAAARLVESSFNHARVSFADFRYVMAKSAYFSGVHLHHAYLNGAVLEEALMTGADLSQADLRRAKLSDANLSGGNLQEANLSGAILQDADMTNAVLFKAKLVRANVREAVLDRADLRSTNLRHADLRGASLSGSLLMNAKLNGSDLRHCRVYGISAWDVDLTGAIQQDLVFTPEREPVATIDDLEVAQFLYLLSRSEKFRNLLDTVTQKVVLILGRFTDPRMAVLNAIREELRKLGYLPVLFTFEPSPSRNLTETVATLASLVRFVVADITDPRSIPQELLAIVEHFVSVPIQPIIAASQKPYGMFESIQERQSVLPLYQYPNIVKLRRSFHTHIVSPAENFARNIVSKRIASQRAKAHM
jgi:uncharacterized protein YjbI with pentapeptide repeats